MELVAFTKQVAQNVAEHAASYRLGQSALRHLDRALWVVEKCARWAVPPPLDQDERPQPELVRPLPWVFFLAMLVSLRITRESISLVNLVLGKPPLRSADVVIYIQSKRRYLRTLKYQGNRMIRARAAPPTSREPWYSGLQSLFEFTMCFRRSQNYGNNNTTRISNNDEVLVVKRSKRTREPTAGPVASTSEATMERLIEKIMVDLDAESDDDSSFTLTNATSVRSDTDSENGTVENREETLTSSRINDTGLEDNDVAGESGQFAHSTPVKDSKVTEESESPAKNKTDLSQPNSEDNQDSKVDAKMPRTEDAASGSPKHKTDLSQPNSESHQDSKEDAKMPRTEEDVASGSPKHKTTLSQPNSESHQDSKEDAKMPRTEDAASGSPKHKTALSQPNSEDHQDSKVDAKMPRTEDAASGSPKHKTALSQPNSEGHRDSKVDAKIPRTEDAASGSPKHKTDMSQPNSESHQDSKEDGKMPRTEDAASGSPKHKTDLSQPNSKEHQDSMRKSEEAVQQSKLLKNTSPKEDTQKFIQGEKCSPQKGQQSPRNTKIANGRPMGGQNKRKGKLYKLGQNGVQSQRRESEIPGSIYPADDAL